MINVSKTFLPMFDQYCDYLKEIWQTAWVTNNGKFVHAIEKELRQYLKVKNLLVVANGTLALQLVLRSLDIQGEVVTTPFTFAATTNAILWEGLTPVFADIDFETYNIDPISIESRITAKTSAILAVHVFGNACDVESLQNLANKYKIKLIYDAAHAFGVEYKNKSLLDFGDCSILSFHATKVYHTLEGGAIIVKDNKLFKKLKLMTNFGIKNEAEVVCLGINAKMNEFQAAMGLCNLKILEGNISKRKKIWERYCDNFNDVSGLKLQVVNNSRSNYGYFSVCFKGKHQRDVVARKLIKYGIRARKYFFPLTSDFDYVKDNAKYTNKNDLKTAHKIANGILCLPIYADLNMKVVDNISNLIKKEINLS